MKIGWKQQNGTIPPMTWMPQRPPNARLDFIGYKAHFTETCDEDLPRFIPHVATTIAPIPDRQALPEIYEALDQEQLLPKQHLVDAGYVDAEAILTSQATWQVDLVGPTAKDYRWQAREQNGYAQTYFSIDWDNEQARCPQGQASSSWTPTRTRNQEVIKITFGYATCGRCPVRDQCTRSRQRTLSVRRHEAHIALEAARQREQTKEFKELYAERAGIEGVHAQAVRRMGLRRSRSVSEPRTISSMSLLQRPSMCVDYMTGRMKLHHI